MRILILSTYFRPDVASTGVIMSKLADELLHLGHEVTVITSVPHYDKNQVWPEYSKKLIHREEKDGMVVHRLYTYIAKDKANVFKRILAYGSFNLLSILKGLTLPKQDVILVPSPPLSNGVIADLLSRFRRVPFIYNVQDIWPDVAVRAGLLSDKRTIRWLEKMEGYVYRRAAKLTVISEGFRRNLVNKGVPGTKLAVIPNFIDTDFVRPRPKVNAFSAKHALQDKCVVLFAGNMGFSQGLETVLDSAKLLDGERDIQFLLVGNGAARDQVKQYANELNLQNVSFLPFQAHEELPDMYGTADVCLIPLKRGFTTESVPCKLFTIMAAAKPAIAAVDPGSDTWQLMEEGKCGLCVPPEDARALANAVLLYAKDSALRLAAGENGRHFVETHFHPRQIAESYEALICSVADRSGGVDTETKLQPIQAE